MNLNVKQRNWVHLNPQKAENSIFIEMLFNNESIEQLIAH